MYTPKEFDITDENEIFKFIKENSFGMLISKAQDKFHVTHIPILLEENISKKYLCGHMAIANEHWKIADNKKVLVIFNGPHHYISPKWYTTPESVPTWNYMTVHIEGILTLMNREEAVSILKNSLEFYEIDSDIRDKMTLPYYEKMVNGVKGFRISIDKINAKYKLSQNRNCDDRISIIKNLKKINTDESNRIADEINKRMKS
ncbi:MAG: FMN-binding negative transcriptional regulator [Thermoplasmataceae archaeon]